MSIMKRYLEAAASTVLLLAATSCSDSPYRPGKSPVVTRVAVSPAVADAGEVFEVGIEVNIRGRDVDVQPWCEELLGYRIRAADGTVVAEYPGSECTLSPITVRLNKGETYAAQLEVGTLLNPGAYEVSAGITGAEDEYPWASAVLEVALPPEVFAIRGTLSIESYDAEPPEFEHTTRQLVGERTDFIVMFDSASAVQVGDLTIENIGRIRSRSRTGYSSRWAFTNPAFGSVWGDLLGGSSVTVSASSFVQLDSGAESRTLNLHVNVASSPEVFNSWIIYGDDTFALDGDGFPILERNIPLAGRFTSGYFAIEPDFSSYTTANVSGTADATALNIGPSPLESASR